MRTLAISLLFSVLFLSLNLYGTVIHVPGDHATIQAAITAAANGDTILVSDGTYLENIDFSGKKIVIGSAFLTSDDTTHIGQTIIDGGGAGVNKSVVSFLSSEDSLSVLVGFTITNGYASGSHGGGITLMSGSRPSIQDCRIVDNLGSPSPAYGIGIQCTGSSPTIVRCLIKNNTATANGNYDHFGGGVYVGSSSAPHFTDCQITGNLIAYSVYYRNFGGGIYSDHSSPVFRNCTITDNAADIGGAVDAFNYSRVVFAHCTFSGNSVRSDGGAVASLIFSIVQTDTCTFFKNSASGNGGALLADQNGLITASGSTVTDNTAGFGAGIYSWDSAAVTITNCIVFYNWWNEIYPTTTLTRITYSDIRGGYPGTGNLDIDPLYCDWITGTYTLASNSPCLTGGAGGSRMGYYPTACGAILPNTRRIPQDYATIQDAIFHAYQGDTVLVDTGSHAENIQFWGRRVLLTSHYTATHDTADVVKTIIDGGGSAVNRSVVSFLGHEDSLSVLVGFMITNGYASGDHGGGITIKNGSQPGIQYCRIVNNLGSPSSFYGIGIQCTGSSPTFLRCRIRDNTATVNGNYDHMGGGVYLASSSAPNFTECQIKGNLIAYSVYYRNFGGGIYSDHSSSVFRYCTITDNTADIGGAIEAVNSSNALFAHCTFSGNSVRSDGGAVASFTSSAVQADTCTFFKNTASGNGGALLATQGGQITASRSTITDNTAGLGAGVYASTATAVAITNCIIFYNWWSEVYPTSTLTQITYSDVRGGYPGTGNLDIDPLYCDWITGTYTLASNSPCLTGGSGSSRMGYYPTACGVILPHTRRIPQDYATIQDAIFHAYQGDTVLVDTGSHAENIQFWGRRVLLTSHYSASGDTADVIQTILNGGGAGVNKSVVSFLANEDSLSVLVGFTITNGYASGDHGGGITLKYGSRPGIQYCRIVNNLGSPSSFYGIGIQCTGSSPTILRCLIKDNSATVNGNYDHMGGGVYLASSSAPHFTDCQIKGNLTAYSVYYRNFGGGIYSDQSFPVFRNCTIAGNTADYGGAIEAVNSSAVTLRNSLVYQNNARSNGGGFYFESSNPIIVNNTISKNNAGESGGGMYCKNSNATVINTILWQDTAQTGLEISVNASSPTVTYSDIAGGWAGTGNISTDPLFMDFSTFLLSETSPCVDTGDPDSVYNDPEDTAKPGFALYPARGTTRSDIGAYGGWGAAGWITGVSEGDGTRAGGIPRSFQLLQNYPNPFNPATCIHYDLPTECIVILKVYTLLGQEIATLSDGIQEAGSKAATWNGTLAASGVYLYRLQARSTSDPARTFIAVKKMVLMR